MSSPVAAPEGQGQSKNAKRRARERAAKEAAAEGGEAAPAPVAAPAKAQEPAPKAKSKAKAAPAPAAPAAPEPKAKAKGKAKAAPAPEPAAPAPKAKGKAKAAPEPPAPEPKAKAKGKAKAAPAAPEPAPAPEPKAKAKGKAKAKAAPAPEPEPVVEEKKEELVNWVLDDGSGGGWEVTGNADKKKAKQAARKAEMAQHAQMAKMANVVGMAGTGLDGKRVPGAPGAAQSLDGTKADVARIMAMKGEAVAVEEPTNSSTVNINVPSEKIGIIIGPGGKTIKEIQEKADSTGKTRIDTTGENFCITGPPNGVAEAHKAIKEMIQKGYCQLLYENFAENMVSVHPSCFPDIIGVKGCVIIELKKALGVEINIPPVPKGSPPGKKFKIALAGSAEKVEQAKQVINDIVMYGHHEITHPDKVHAELEVEQWYYSFIIGKAGSELRHIQKNWDVKVSIPREHSTNQNVLIVGERDNVERAKAYIEKLLWNAENNVKSGRDRIEASDGWEGEEEEEPWMKAYIYKRA